MNSRDGWLWVWAIVIFYVLLGLMLMQGLPALLSLAVQ